MRIEQLVIMVNEIAAFFAGSDAAQAPDNIANHLRRYWDPRMRKQIIEHAASGAPDLSPLARAGVEMLASKQSPRQAATDPPPQAH